MSPTVSLVDPDTHMQCSNSPVVSFQQPFREHVFISFSRDFRQPRLTENTVSKPSLYPCVSIYVAMHSLGDFTPDAMQHTQTFSFSCYVTMDRIKSLKYPVSLPSSEQLLR